MSQPLWLDPGELHASAAELDQVAAETAQMVAELKEAFAREGECWGGDKPGNAFAEGYLPSTEQSMAGFEDLVNSARAMSAGLRAAADTFTEADRAGGTQLRDAAAAWSGPVGSVPVAAAPAARASAPDTADRAAPADRQPLVSGRSTGNSSAGDPESRATNDAEPAAAGGTEQPQPVRSGPEPVRTGPDPARGQSEPPQAGSAEPSSGKRVPEDPLEQPPTLALPWASAPGVSALRSIDAGLTTAPESSKPVAARAEASRAATGTPWSSTAPSSPRPGSAAPQENQIPPRTVPPRTADRPPTQAKPDADSRRNPPPRARVAARPRRETGDAAMEILRDMALRHDLEIVGFETAGIAEHTAQEIADAVDTVVTAYPVILRGLEVAEGGPPSRVENRNEAVADPAATSSLSPQPWIVLSDAAAADPGVLGGNGPAGHAAAVREVLRQRPMYVTVLLELGHALDLTGGLCARAQAQRALITEYLRISGAQGERLGRIVSGYKSWRAELGGYCFDDGAFSPGRALAAGFAAVEVDSAAAPASARTLHRLLVALAHAALPDLDDR
ncbi:WXG100 family type VII secretion target [Nocardia sienata]|uniref:WXG100 family type VII secretion target n=1 Tax=Nocardia sienata TaxID=248552 RepID=UPI0007A49E37|nr:WXG100 family type VII secretion target [Nocardia sienata]